MSRLHGMITEDGETSIIEVPHGRADIALDGTFGGATVEIQRFNSGSEQFQTFDDAAFTIPTVQVLDLVASTLIRLRVTGATGTTSIGYDVRLDVTHQ